MYSHHLKNGEKIIFFRFVGESSLYLIENVQLLDRDQLFIKLASYDRDGNLADASSNTCFFLFYCISWIKILNLFANKSLAPASLFFRFYKDFIRNSLLAASLTPQWGPSPADTAPCPYQYPRHEQIKKRMQSLLATVPLFRQIQKLSIYLDCSLLTYNSKYFRALHPTKSLALRRVRSCEFHSAYTANIWFKLALNQSFSQANQP